MLQVAQLDEAGDEVASALRRTPPFTKILALALAPDESLRRVTEEDLCGQVMSVACKPAYLVIPDSEMGD